ncbi:hypothetical protein XfCFBP8356_009015 [Xylella fastidiosa subsp. sandyi]|uniref:hypothetical protein n=1 Tax=Xylella fastidiosa TaxID=2371 RepID=UPI000FFE4B4E|nr:hypothetical protein [Xylella fastidiosa]RWA43330.1 hypothetical protein XfCFBP8356_12520 [Xylella fastidiosa subsp. sandyi]
MKASNDSGAVDTVHSGDGDAMSTAVRFFFDISGMQEQLKQLVTLVENIPVDSRKRAVELALGFLDQLSSDKKFDSDLFFSQHVSTPVADGTVHVTYSALFGAEFEGFLSALPILASVEATP